MKKTELIWVDEDFAKQYEKIASDEEKYKVFEEYLNKISEESKKEFRANLENLEEDVAVYTGLMLKVKQAFGKAKDEQLTASYTLWENFEKEIPNTSEKIEQLTSLLDPLEKKIDAINKKLGQIQTYNIEKLLETLENFERLSGKSEEMFKFVIKHFKNE